MECAKKHASELKIEKNWKGLEMVLGYVLSLLAPALGSKGLILVDSGNFAHKDMSLYKKQIENFKKISRP